MENTIENTEQEISTVSLFESLLSIFVNDSKLQRMIVVAKNRGDEDLQILGRVVKLRPRNVKLKELIENSGYVLDGVHIEPKKKLAGIPRVVMTKAATKRRETENRNQELDNILKDEDLKNKLIQDFLDSKGYKEIPKFEGSRPLNKEAELISKQRMQNTEQAKQNRKDEWKDLDESDYGIRSLGGF